MNERDYPTYLFHQGTNYRSYELLGCNLNKIDNYYIITFCVWAPNADTVYLVCDIFGWDKPQPMYRDKDLWRLEFKDTECHEGALYKYIIEKDGNRIYKGDPYAFYSKGRDDGASIIYNRHSFLWSDENWLKSRSRLAEARNTELSTPINIYEMHLGSFMRNNGKVLTYRQLAELLPTYLKALSFTHVEFLPIAEHPFDGSWGYQICAYYAPSSTFGSPNDFKHLINELHKAGIGVIVDWVPAHFPKDEWGLYEFDGSPLYEYQGADRQESKLWGTRFFDLGRGEVRSFLISNAMYLFKELHIDGIRVDAVASMIYLDYDRDGGEWIPNIHGTNINLEATSFLAALNSAIHSELPDALMIAEESGTLGKITHPVCEGGLGFDLKWNMGWANDFFDYLSVDPIKRHLKHKALNFPIMYGFSERYILPISHDEVVHGKKSFADKSQGTIDEKLADSRAGLLFQLTFPGKKLSFMGYEFSQIREWDHSSELEWFMLDFPKHFDHREFVRALNLFYLERAELWELDHDPRGFEWIYCDEADKNTIAYKRYSLDGEYLSVFINFSGSEQELELPNELIGARKLFDTGNIYSDIFYKGKEGKKFIKLPPRAGVVLEEGDSLIKFKT